MPGLIEACYAVADLGPWEATFPFAGYKRRRRSECGKEGIWGRNWEEPGKRNFGQDVK